MRAGDPPFLCEPMGFAVGPCGAQFHPGHLDAHSTVTPGRQQGANRSSALTLQRTFFASV